MADVVVNGSTTNSDTLNNGSINTKLDIVAGDDPNHTIRVGNGTDTIVIGNGNNNDIIVGGGNDQVTVGSGDNTITAGNGNDSFTLVGDSVILGTDTLFAGVGNYSFVATDNVQLTIHLQSKHGQTAGETLINVTPISNNQGGFTYNLSAQNSTIGNQSISTNSNGIFSIFDNQLSFTNEGSSESTFNFANFSSTVSITGSAVAPETIALSSTLNGIGEIFDLQTIATVSGGTGPYTYAVTGTGISPNTYNFSETTLTFSPPLLGITRLRQRLPIIMVRSDQPPSN